MMEIEDKIEEIVILNNMISSTLKDLLTIKEDAWRSKSRAKFKRLRVQLAKSMFELESLLYDYNLFERFNEKK